ncbi:MAG TPA: ABC transporter permease [Blastocatellia bacterium]|nr:ABC transporter permease [Blastocatellia bacterium]HMV84059.1 ABC transporter permease [Blastocatellia bacterium]HMX26541.1 ABC transporter permease [Blastocatellia bacterium]HMY72625.1 ABC transporter permease [Blastocatellia bacterium]HMZ19560.1 ABC transporter permease [Blastocatellia bacterium]
MQTLWQDLRFGARMLVKRPGFTLIAVVTLALGIGANTAIFSVVNAFLLRPLPYREPERLVMIQPRPAADYGAVFSYPVFQAVREQSGSFEHLAAFANRRLTFDGGGEPEMAFGARVTREFFAVLGVTPWRARGFAPEDEAPDKPPLALLSYSFWQRRFGGDPNIVGQTITADKERVEIAGVLPHGFKTDLLPDFPKCEFWLLLKPGPRLPASYNINEFRFVGRLKTGVTLAQARGELDLLAQRFRQNNPQAGDCTV